MGIDSHRFQLFDGFRWVAAATRLTIANFLAAVADENELDFVLEPFGTIDVIFANRSTAEKSDV